MINRKVCQIKVDGFGKILVSLPETEVTLGTNGRSMGRKFKVHQLAEIHIADIRGITPYPEGCEIELNCGILKTPDDYVIIQQKWEDEIKRMEAHQITVSEAAKKIC